MSVTVWWASPAHARDWHEQLLTPAERQRADAYRRRQDRDRFVTANALLRITVARQLGRTPDIDRTCSDCGQPHGKPAVVGGGVDVSVSHSGEWITVALSTNGSVGVDVEQIRPDKDLELLLPYVFSPEELKILPDPPSVFYQVWARKESILKATGEGLRMPMAGLTVLPETTYNVHDLAPRPGYAAAVTLLTPGPVLIQELDGTPLLLDPPS